MDPSNYLQSYGWRKGEALKRGGLKRPILVKHKKDQKGLGHNHDNQEAWWERVFDGQLKGLDVNVASEKVSFNQREIKVSGMSRHVSPLYKNFVSGGILAGTIEDQRKGNKTMPKSNEKLAESTVIKDRKRKRDINSNGKEQKQRKKGKSEKNDKKKEKLKKKEIDNVVLGAVKEDVKSKKERKLSLSKQHLSQSNDDWMRSLVRQMRAEKAAVPS
jgi:nucleolar protein TMA23